MLNAPAPLQGQVKRRGESVARRHQNGSHRQESDARTEADWRGNGGRGVVWCGVVWCRVVWRRPGG